MCSVLSNSLSSSFHRGTLLSAPCEPTQLFNSHCCALPTAARKTMEEYKFGGAMYHGGQRFPLLATVQWRNGVAMYNDLQWDMFVPLQVSTPSGYCYSITYTRICVEPTAFGY